MLRGPEAAEEDGPGAEQSAPVVPYGHGGPYGILLYVQLEIPLTGRLGGHVLLQDLLLGYAEGRLPEDVALALHVVEETVWRLICALRACGIPEELPYLRVASPYVDRRWQVAPTSQSTASESGSGR